MCECTRGVRMLHIGFASIEAIAMALRMTSAEELSSMLLEVFTQVVNNPIERIHYSTARMEKEYPAQLWAATMETGSVKANNISNEIRGYFKMRAQALKLLLEGNEGSEFMFDVDDLDYRCVELTTIQAWEDMKAVSDLTYQNAHWYRLERIEACLEYYRSRQLWASSGSATGSKLADKLQAAKGVWNRDCEEKENKKSQKPVRCASATALRDPNRALVRKLSVKKRSKAGQRRSRGAGLESRGSGPGVLLPEEPSTRTKGAKSTTFVCQKLERLETCFLVPSVLATFT